MFAAFIRVLTNAAEVGFWVDVLIGGFVGFFFFAWFLFLGNKRLKYKKLMCLKSQLTSSYKEYIH